MMRAAAGRELSAPPAALPFSEKLHELGYAQELMRGMGAFSNFAVSFTIISILSGCLTLFGFGMYTGGPAASAYGWPLVGLLVTFVSLSMAEICSSYPTAGGLYRCRNRPRRLATGSFPSPMASRASLWSSRPFIPSR